MPSKIYIYNGLGLEALLLKGPKALIQKIVIFLVSHGKVGKGLDVGFDQSIKMHCK